MSFLVKTCRLSLWRLLTCQMETLVWSFRLKPKTSHHITNKTKAKLSHLLETDPRLAINTTSNLLTVKNKLKLMLWKLDVAVKQSKIKI